MSAKVDVAGVKYHVVIRVCNALPKQPRCWQSYIQPALEAYQSVTPGSYVLNRVSAVPSGTSSSLLRYCVTGFRMLATLIIAALQVSWWRL